MLDPSLNFQNEELPTDKSDMSLQLKNLRALCLQLSTKRFNSIMHLFLDGNNLLGRLPKNLFQLQNLRTLNLHDNLLFGSLDAGIFNLSNLVELDISYNSFSGLLPDLFGGLGELEKFSASSNSFTDHLPASLLNPQSLLILHLHNNSLNGPINLNCSAAVRLISLHLDENEKIPVDVNFHFKNLKAETQRDGATFKYKGIWSFPPTLDLSYNKLAGPIWASFGNLKELHILNLKENPLSGTISDSFVAYSRPHGEIPTGGQFMSFPPSSFEGNEGLCGGDLTPCQPQQTPHVQPVDEEMTTMSLQYGLGAATGFFLTVAFCFISGLGFS
ncbi:unnamed protein product [Dovyalis caffra]|uniref:Uncharacterized protein n=1 Tax=Dovyalis caffra TaxID=77055 RepID=A0AAV1R7N9_9ROSI|nr:unnamed protein product [Dovyalis caffra]